MCTVLPRLESGVAIVVHHDKNILLGRLAPGRCRSVVGDAPEAGSIRPPVRLYGPGFFGVSSSRPGESPADHPEYVELLLHMIWLGIYPPS